MNPGVGNRSIVRPCSSVYIGKTFTFCRRLRGRGVSRTMRCRECGAASYKDDGADGAVGLFSFESRAETVDAGVPVERSDSS